MKHNCCRGEKFSMSIFLKLVLFMTYYKAYQCYSARQYEHEILSICLNKVPESCSNYGMMCIIGNAWT